MTDGTRWFGFNPPFVGGARGVLSRQTGDRLVKNDLLALLHTMPGERLMRPDFGTRLRAFVFENYDEEDVFALQQEIRRQIERHEQRVVVNRVVVTPNEETMTIHVVVDVSPVDNPQTNYLIEVSQGGRRL